MCFYFKSKTAFGAADATAAALAAATAETATAEGARLSYRFVLKKRKSLKITTAAVNTHRPEAGVFPRLGQLSFQVRPGKQHKIRTRTKFKSAKF